MFGQASGQHFEIYYNFIDTFTGTLSKYLQVVFLEFFIIIEIKMEINYY